MTIKKNIHSTAMDKKGFSLVELLVVISVIAVLSISSIVGFGYLGDILKAREATGYLNDLIQQEELKVLRGDFEKATFYWFTSYMVIAERAQGADPDLLVLGENTSCPSEHDIRYGEGKLSLWNEKGEILEVKNVTTGTQCVPFENAPNTEWNYQLVNGDKVSDIIRFVHFNLNREDTSNPLRINDDGAGARLEIFAPYGKKTIYDTESRVVDSWELEVGDEDENSSDTLLIK